jgi:hypothetical protein
MIPMQTAVMYPRQPVKGSSIFVKTFKFSKNAIDNLDVMKQQVKFKT